MLELQLKYLLILFLSFFSVLGFGGLLYGTSSISEKGFDNPIVLVSMIGGIVLVALFVLRQYRLSTPLLNFAVFKNKQFTVGIIIMGVTMVSMIGSETILPILCKIYCIVQL